MVELAELAEPVYRALLIGVTGYQKEHGFSPLLGPATDVMLLEQALARPAGLHEVDRIEDPDAGLEDRIAEYLAIAGAAEEILIYFSGHGEVDDNGVLRLAHIRSVQSRLTSSAVAFANLWDYALRSRARSVVFVLDCCRAGEAEAYPGASVGTAVQDAAEAVTNPNAAPVPSGHRRVRAVLPAGVGLAVALDTERAGEPSPFTREFIKALGEAVPNADGTVTLGAALDVLRASAAGRGVPRERLPTVVGPTEARDVRIWLRADFREARLTSLGLTNWELHRTGAAVVDGHEVRIVTPLELEVADRLRDFYPTSVLVSDARGRGKTWLLCAVAEALRRDGWEVLSYRPSLASPDPDRLLTELHRLLAFREAEDGAHKRRRLVVVDGIEWSNEWAAFIDAVATREPSGAGSVIVAVESSRLTRWPQRLDLVRAAPAVPSRIGQLCRALVELEVFAPYRPTADGAMEGAAVRLEQAAGLDLWAAAHLAWAVLTGDGNAEEQLASTWNEHLGTPSPEAKDSLGLIAALSSFGLAAPVSLVADSQDFWNRLGAEVGGDGSSVRFISPFVQRALITDGRRLTNPNQSQIDREVTDYVLAYLKTLFPQPQRQQIVRAALRQLRARPASLERTVRRLTDPVGDGQKSTIDLWEESRPALSDYVDVLAMVRPLLPHGITRRLIRRLSQRLDDGETESLALPELLTCLDILERYRGGDDGPEQVATREMLVEQITERLRERTWSASLRSRLVRLLFRTDAEAAVGLPTVAPLVARPSEPATAADLEVVVSILIGLRHRDTRTADEVTSALLSSDHVDRLLTRPASVADESTDMLVGRIRIDRMLRTTRFPDPAGILRQRLISAPLASRARVVQQLSRTAPDLAANVVEWSNQSPKQLRNLYSTAPPAELASWLSAAGRFDPEMVARSLRRGQAVDIDLVLRMARAVRRASDPVGAGRLLEAAAAVEDQAEMKPGGFAEALGAELGSPFLRDQMRDNRVTVLANLIKAYAASSTAIGDEALTVAEELISKYIATSSGDFGPRLALTLLDSETISPALLDRIRRRVRRSTMLVRMRQAYEPSAVAAYHRLGALLFPGIEQDFRYGLDELDIGGDDWFLNGLPERTDPLQVLQAGQAYSDTLLAGGEAAAGEQTLRAFDRHFAGGRLRWVPARLYRARDGDLAQCLALLHGMAPVSARGDVGSEVAGLTRVLVRNEDVPTVFLSLLAEASRCSSRLGTELVERCRERGALQRILDSVLTETNLFTQVEQVSQVVRIAGRTGRDVIDRDALGGVVEAWLRRPALPTNPHVLLSILRVVEALGSSWVDRLHTHIDAAPLRRRFARRSPAESSSTVRFIVELADVSPALAGEALPARVARWYVQHCPLVALPAMVEMVLDCHPEIDVQSIVLDRFFMSEQRLVGVSRYNFWRTLGTVCWSIQREGQLLDLPAPPAAFDPVGLPAAEAVWSVGWLADSAWTTKVLERAIPPERWDEEEMNPWRAGAWLAVAAHSGWNLADAHATLWHLAASAPRPVLDAALAASASSTNHETNQLAAMADGITERFVDWRARDRRARGYLASIIARLA